MKTVLTFFVVALMAFLLDQAYAQSSTSGPVVPADNPPAAAPSAAPPPAPGASTYASSAAQAVATAQDGIDESVRGRIVSVYGVGTPAAIARWWVIFYDPSVASHGRAVKVENGEITKTYEANGGVVYDRDLTFLATRVSGEGAAVANAQNYAAQHAIAYDGVRALLRRNTPDGPLRWRVELMSGADNRGFVFSDASSGTFAMYSPPGSVPTGTSGSTGGLVGDAKKFGNDVKHTFLGIGGDLQEFFTGERTVDQ